MSRALQVNLVDQKVVSNFVEVVPRTLEQGEVRIAVAYSAVNYKDYLAFQYRGGVIRDYPMIPGVDASGTVIESADPHFQVGDPVLISGYDFGVREPGGYQTELILAAQRVLPLPAGLTLRTAMIVGTAGLAAWLAIDKLKRQGALPSQDEILVTGATGGVGSLALAFLKALGYQQVSALTRQRSAHEQLTKLGATCILDPALWQDLPDKPLLPGRYQAVIDTVGGQVASQAVAQLQPEGVAALVGNAASNSLPTTVLPFILRGIDLLGIDVVSLPMAERQVAWTTIGQVWPQVDYPYVQEVDLTDLPEVMANYKEQSRLGRLLVKLG